MLFIKFKHVIQSEKKRKLDILFLQHGRQMDGEQGRSLV